jgi:hypothetical protein
MEQLIQSHKAVLIFTPGSSNTLATTKIHRTGNVIFGVQQLILCMAQVMFACRSVFDVLVLERQY